MLGLTKSPYFKRQSAILLSQNNRATLFCRATHIDAKSKATKSPSLKEVSFALRQYALMRFLQFPKTAKTFATTSTALINKGGMWQRVTEKAIGPLTKSFSAGETVPKAVKNALPLLAKDQHLLLDYTEEMIFKPADRVAVFHEINKLLNEVAKTPLSYIPIKLTALICPIMLEKMSRDETLNETEKQLLEAEKTHLYKLVDNAAKLGKVIFIDQEYPHQKKAIFNFALDLMARYNQTRPVVYITIQATDIECSDLLKKLAEHPEIRFPAIKLVNGAYVNWAHQNGYSHMIQPSKMSAFVAFVLMAKFCLRKGVHLYMGTHNPILEQLVDNAAQALGITNGKYVKGQLYGFTTKKDIKTMYSIFGPTPSCIHYSLRRVIEGAGSNSAATAPTLPSTEVATLIKKSNLQETLSTAEIAEIGKAVKLNVQETRVELARDNLYKALRL